MRNVPKAEIAVRRPMCDARQSRYGLAASADALVNTVGFIIPVLTLLRMFYEALPGVGKRGTFTLASWPGCPATPSMSISWTTPSSSLPRLDLHYLI
jgi:hypothetical protein